MSRANFSIMARSTFVTSLLVGGAWLGPAAYSQSGVTSTTVVPLAPASPTIGSLAPAFDQVDLFVSGTLGTHTYRIPALAVTPNGTIVAICDARRDNSSDLPGNIDIVMRRSLDGGKTWTPQVVIEDLPPGHGAGDPSLLVDRVTGRIFCFYAYGPPGIGFFNSQPGSSSVNDPNTLHAHVIFSDDEGATWSAARDLNPEIKAPAWRAIFASSGAGIQLRNGRLLQPYAVSEASGPTRSRNAYSDDHGATWQMGLPSGSNTNESKLVELNFGIVMQNMRHNSTPARYLSYSVDGGHSFGSMFRDVNLIDPRVNAGLAVLRSLEDGDPDDLLAFTNPWSTTNRHNLEVRLSSDEGATWPRARIVHPGPAAYSTLLDMGRGEIGLLYERGFNSAYERVTFARFTESWVDEKPRLLDGAGRPNPRHPDLWAWFDAADDATMNGPGPDSDGDPVTRWDDLSALGLHDLPRSSDGRAAFRTGAVNGWPAVHFLGDVDVWGAASAEFGALQSPFTIAIVARVDSTGGTSYLFDKTTGAGGLGLRVNAGRWEVHAERLTGAAPFNQIVPSAQAVAGRWQLHVVMLDGDQLQHRIDGALVASTTINDGGEALVQRGMILGADFRTDRDSNAWVTELAAFRRILRVQELAQLTAGLRQRYGI